MTSRNSQYMLQQQVNARKRFDDQDRSFAEKVAAARRQSIADKVCLVCEGPIIDGACETCQQEYEILPFSDESAVTS